MPIYEYKCKSCGRLIEVIQKMGAPPLKTCESCSGPLEKILSRTSFQLSGGGWSSSGYSKGGSSSTNSGTAESAGAAETKPDSKPDTKSDVKSDPGKEPSKASGGGCGTGCGCH